MKCPVVLALAVLSLASASGTASHAANTTTSPVESPWPIELRRQIARVNHVGYRLNLAAAPLCIRTGSATGIAVDYIGAYEKASRTSVGDLLGMGDLPQVAAVAPGSPADRAGVRSGDTILAINARSSADLIRTSNDPSLIADEIETLLETSPIDQPVHLTVRHIDSPAATGGQKISILPERACAVRFVVKTGEGVDAFGDGRNVAIGYELAQFTQNDDELALVAGHELAHIVEGNAGGGLKSRRAREDHADALGARLSACAGYDIEKGLGFWQRYNKRDWLRFLRMPTHRSVPQRIELIRASAGANTCPPKLVARSGPAAPQRRTWAKVEPPGRAGSSAGALTSR